MFTNLQIVLPEKVTSQAEPIKTLGVKKAIRKKPIEKLNNIVIIK